jgi:hypothetical protein
MAYWQSFEFFLTRTQKRISWRFNSDQKVIFLSQADSKMFDYLGLNSAQLLSCVDKGDAEKNITDSYDGGAYAVCVYLHGVPAFTAVFPQSKRGCDDGSKRVIPLLARTVVNENGRFTDDFKKLLDSFSDQGALYFLFDFSRVSNPDYRDLFLTSAFESPVRSFIFLPADHFSGIYEGTPKQGKIGFDFASFFLFAFFSLVLVSFLFLSVYFYKSIFLGLPLALLFFLMFGLFSLFSFSDESFFLKKSPFLNMLFFGRKRVGGALLGALLFLGMAIVLFKFGVIFLDNKAFTLSFLVCILFIPLFLFLLRFLERNKIHKHEFLS